MAEIPLGIKVRHYRCFGNTFAGFDTIKPINVLIGRNNSGKSALLDVVYAACQGTPQFRQQDWSGGQPATLEFTAAVPEQTARGAFPEAVNGGDIRARNHWIVGQQYVGKRITWTQASGSPAGARIFSGISQPVDAQLYRPAEAQLVHENALVRVMANPLEGKQFRRLAAERNVRPEGDSTAIDPQPDGTNVTNLIQRFYNLASMDRSVVEVTLLDALNSIVEPDYRFDEIVLRRLENGEWEIFLREDEKGLIALSASGSGLKTIICVLATMTLWPIANNVRQLSSYIFALEELENNLHPALLRRLLKYITDRVKAENGTVFLTTHSSAAIDLFAAEPAAQIIHTTHRPGGQTSTRTVDEYLHRRDVLHDLDVRASDLLQSNGLIWVEGPSDRIYVNHWIAQITGSELQEGTHYQCVFYGGRLLAHLDALDPENNDDDLISILRINQNAAIVIDSDKSAPDDDINATKQRIQAEMARVEGFTWITAGREIENYLPGEAIVAASGVEGAGAAERYARLGDYLEGIQEGAGRRFERKKTEFAAEAVARVTLQNQQPILDWRDRMDQLIWHIRRWNRLPQPVPVG